MLPACTVSTAWTAAISAGANSVLSISRPLQPDEHVASCGFENGDGSTELMGTVRARVVRGGEGFSRVVAGRPHHSRAALFCGGTRVTGQESSSHVPERAVD